MTRTNSESSHPLQPEGYWARIGGQRSVESAHRSRGLKLVLESLMHWFKEGRHPVLQLETSYAYEPAQWAIVVAAL